MTDQLVRLAVINKDRCKPKKCPKECKGKYPIVRSGKNCIRVSAEAALTDLLLSAWPSGAPSPGSRR